MMVNWGMISLVYYGAGLSSTTLGGDIFLNFTLVAFMEVLGNIGAALIINHWGRKTTLVMGFILAAIRVWNKYSVFGFKINKRKKSYNNFDKINLLFF